jgi:hypothetical protein
VAVHDDGLVNLAIFDAEGTPHARQRVRLYQDEEVRAEEGGYAEWMPYQIGQAKRQESVGTSGEIRSASEGSVTLPKAGEALQINILTGASGSSEGIGGA